MNKSSISSKEEGDEPARPKNILIHPVDQDDDH